MISGTKHILAGIDSPGFKVTYASQYYTERTEFRREENMRNNLSIGAEVLQQIICTIKIRRGPAGHDNVEFKPIITRTSNILPLSVVTADKGYDSENNHLLVRDGLLTFGGVAEEDNDELFILLSIF